MYAVPWDIVCGGLSLTGAVLVAALGSSGRMPRSLAVPIAAAFFVSGALWLLFAGAGSPWIYVVYLETWPITVLILADAAALCFLIALWAGASDVHWFWRLGVMFSALALLTVIEMIEPLLMLLAGMVPVMMAGYWWKRWQRRGRCNSSGEIAERNVTVHGRWRMRLQSAFLVFVIVGLVGVILRSAVHANLYVVWSGLLAEAAIFSGLSLATAAVAVAPWQWRLALVPLWCIASWVVIHWHNVILPDWAGWRHVINVSPKSPEAAGLLILGWVTFMALVGATVWLASAGRRAPSGSLQRRVSQTALAAILLLTMIPLVRVYWGLIPLQKVVGESELIGKSASDESSTFEQLASNDWKLRWPWDARLGERFDDQLLLAAEILKTPDRIWVDPDYVSHCRLAEVEDHYLRVLRSLFYHFDRGQWIAASEGDVTRARVYATAQQRIVELLETSNLPEHAQEAGSLHFYWMVNYLSLHEQYSADELVEVLDSSAAFVARQPSTAELHTRRLALHDHAKTWRNRLVAVSIELATGRPQNVYWPNDAEMRTPDNRNRANHEGLRIQLALQLYRRQHGQWPERLADLTPDILKEVPPDPFSPQAAELPVYIRTGDSYLLYSRGIDGVDNGGNFARKQEDWDKAGFDDDLKIDPAAYGRAFPWRTLPIAPSKSEPNSTLPMASP
ncbi:MAG TPA: hypothetical protein VMP01_28270 [Pirellulaceae bacterium]|nr:hypothetical protein [Pirellulaceae bacterium]